MKETLIFLKELAANNNRDWFNANKDRYLKVKEFINSLTLKLISTLSEFDPEAAGLSVANSTYRIYRDTRFSTDKTPYKTHIGIFMCPPDGKKSLRCGYYLHIEPGNCFFAAGTIGHPAPVLKAIRQSVFDEIDEYRSIVESEEFRAVFQTIGEDSLKTAPKGFPKDWEYIDYLKPRNFCCSGAVDEKKLCKADPANLLRPYFKQAKRFDDFINYAIDECIEKNPSF